MTTEGACEVPPVIVIVLDTADPFGIQMEVSRYIQVITLPGTSDAVIKGLLLTPTYFPLTRQSKNPAFVPLVTLAVKVIQSQPQITVLLADILTWVCVMVLLIVTVVLPVTATPGV
jgi:hypothetical protein